MSALQAIMVIAATALLALALYFGIAYLRIRSRHARLSSILGVSPGDLEPATREAAEAVILAGEMTGCQTRIGQLMAVSPVPVLLLDESRVILDLSNRAEEELDQPRRRRGLLETMGSHELDDAVSLAIESQKPSVITMRLYAHGRRQYEARIYPYRTERGSECLVFLKDVSDSMKFGELRSQFAATVSHELRTPLAGIRALVESLKDPDISPGDAARFLEKVDRETVRLNQLIDEILFLSSLESGAEALEGDTELGPLVDQLLDKMSLLVARHEVTVKSSIPAGLVVPLKERMASTVLSNLIDNAIKYSGRGSKIEVSAEREGDRLKISVSDNGIGIDAEHLPHIFERFYRVDRSRSRSLGGTGLGLSIVKHIVESAGGEIGADSREGFGTEITVFLPLP